MPSSERIYDAHLTIEINGTTPAHTARFIQSILNLDASSLLGAVIVPGEGWQKGTEAPKHQHEILRTFSCTRVGNRYEARIIFDFEIPHRYVRLVTPYVTRLLRRHFVPTTGPGVIYSTSFYCLDFPTDEWKALCDRHKPPAPASDTDVLKDF